jgi:hypothetical protein
MTAAARTSAELRKLAHSVDVPVEALSMLADLPADDVRTLRKQVGEALFQADKHYFSRMATLVRSVPTALAVKVTEAVIPPLIAARTAELLEPARAAELVVRMKESYLADVSARMDAARAPEVVAAIPTDKVAAVGRELARREEWVVIGGFVAQVTDEALAASVAELDGGQLLRVGFVLDDVTRIDHIGGLLTDRQVDEMVTAAAEDGLWTELTEVVSHLEAPRVARMAARFAELDASVRDAYAAADSSGALDRATLELLTG